ncbi:MAG: MBL fold metallo-hydrolase [Bacteroidota bacterium]
MSYTPPIRLELPTLFGMKTVNAYLFVEPEPVLIDCGEKTPQNIQAIRESLAKEGLEITDLQKIIITHAHVDHMGAAASLAKESRAKVYLPSYAWPWAVDLPNMRENRIRLIKENLNLYGAGPETVVQQTFARIFQAFGTAWEAIPEEYLMSYEEGDFLELGGNKWEVLYTPGHCINQCCFYQQEAQHLISSDMLLSITPSPVIDPSLENPNERVKGLLQMLDSYKRLNKLEIQKVFPGHYEAFDNAHETIRQQEKRIHRRKLECLSLIDKGIRDPHEIFTQMYGKNVIGWAMMVGYLDLLEYEGYIELIEKNSKLQIFRNRFKQESN